LLLATLTVASLSRVEGSVPRLPAEVDQALASPTAVTLYSTNPDSRAFHRWFTRWFHGHRILGQVSIVDPAQQRQVTSVVRRTAQTYLFDTKCIFSPRHAVRLSSGPKTYDFLICFECSQMEVYSNDRLITQLSASGSPDLFNRILHAAHVRVAP
jgi:hypothetical protein